MSTPGNVLGNTGNDQTQASEDRDQQWEGVFTAITERWPQIDREELRRCDRSVGELTGFVSLRVSENQDEVESIVKEFAPPAESRLHSVLDPVAQQVHDVSQRFSGSMHSAMDRARYQVDEAPLRTSASVFLLGFGLGVLAATVYFRAQPDPTLWQQVRANRFFG